MGGVGWAVILLNFLTGLGNKATESTREATRDTYGFESPPMEFFIPPIIGVIIIVASLLLLAVAFVGAQQLKQQEAAVRATTKAATAKVAIGKTGAAKTTAQAPAPDVVATPAPAPTPGGPDAGSHTSFMDKLAAPQVQALIGLAGLALGLLQLALAAA